LPSLSQTPLTQTSLPTASVQVPSSVGDMCAPSFGSATPLATCGAQVWLVSLHQLPALQSASTSQPPIGSQTPEVLHAPERQTTVAVPAVHGPSPGFRPHLPSGSQTFARQTAAGEPGVQVPSPFA
jgi:hypothetical protein